MTLGMSRNRIIADKPMKQETKMTTMFQIQSQIMAIAMQMNADEN